MHVLILMALAAAAAWSAEFKFRAQEIEREFGVGYAVLIEDVNRDGKPDITAISPTDLVWWENPTWTKHVVMSGATKKDNVCFAPRDIDGDGKIDWAVGADWQPTNTAAGGSLQWVSSAGKVTPLGEEPTLHRMRWGDVDGDGVTELIVVPLHGRGTKGPEWEGAGARILVYWPRQDGAWKMEVADASLHIVHNFVVVSGEIWTASKEGVHALKRDAGGAWSKRKLGAGAPGEIKLGTVNRVRHLATVEPWHGNKIVVYREPVAPLTPQGPTQVVRKAEPGAEWPREEIETGLSQAHALGWADFDGDGSDELAVGWRGKPFGVAVYDRDEAGRWSKAAVDDGMAAEDLAVGDLNGDGRPEIVAAGRATQNIRIYWNETEAPWKRHTIATGFRNQTAIAADFTGDGLVDVITNDIDGKRTLLLAAPDWKAMPLHEGVNAIHSAAMDVDGDGDIDYIGARYSPGLVFWLENQGRAGGRWPFHVVDDHAAGGVNGIHGLILGDIDRDGKPDLIANSAQPTPPFPNSIAWFGVPRNPRKAAGWTRHVFADKDAGGLSHYMGVGDVNGDGRPDVAAGAKIAQSGNWFAWWEQPKGKDPWRRHTIAAGQEGATNIHIADLNGDGRADFFASRGHGQGVVWYEAPEWTAHEVDPSITGPHSLAIGDIDGDGDTDAATCAKDSGIAAWYENDGKGNFQVHYVYEDQSAYDIRLVDMDRDGDLDMLIAGQESANVVWMENRLRQPAAAAKRRTQ